jgi:periplasmic divalent cation tolerance protein
VKAADAYLVITNLPDRDSAGRLAHALIEKRLAACVNVLSPCRSVYRWQGNTEDGRNFRC